MGRAREKRAKVAKNFIILIDWSSVEVGIGGWRGGLFAKVVKESERMSWMKNVSATTASALIATELLLDFDSL